MGDSKGFKGRQGLLKRFQDVIGFSWYYEGMSSVFSEGLSEAFQRVRLHGTSVEFKGKSTWAWGFERFQGVSMNFRGFQRATVEYEGSQWASHGGFLRGFKAFLRVSTSLRGVAEGF